MRRKLIGLIPMFFCLAVAQPAPAARSGGRSAILVSKGKPEAVIVIPENAHPDEKLAAQEIVDHVKKMSGAELPVEKGTARNRDNLQIVIGMSLSPKLEAKIRAKGSDPASYILSVRKQRIAAAGLTPEGTLFAAYDLLEQLGIRWFMPGDFGTVIPSEKNVRLPVQEKIEVPSFKGRKLQSVSDRTWLRRMKLGGIDGGGHGFPIRANRKERPDLYCEENGKPTHQIRVDNPEVLKLTVEAMLARLRKKPNRTCIAIGPADGAGFGTSPWDAGDMDPLHGRISVTDRYIKFFNLVLEQVQKEFPEAGISFYAYAQYMRPPVREKPNPKILPVFAPIDLCRFHSVDNPICPERAYMKTVISGWQALGCDVLYRGYFFNLADHGLPFSMIRQISEEIPYFHKAGIIGCRVECMPMWGHHAPSLYLATRLFWDVNADPDAVMNDFFTKFYGAAARPAHEYFNILEDAFYNADYHTGNVFDMPHILTAGVMKSLADQLAGAKKLASTNPVAAARVAGLQLVHDYGEVNLGMMAALNDFEFEKAKQLHDEAVAIRDKAIAHKPPLLWPRASKNYMRRFWSGTVNSAAECVRNGNEIAVKLPDEWLFMIDPLDGGEDMGFWKPGMGTRNWIPMKTKSSSWSNQGMRYYKGEAWYRTSADVPARFKDRPIKLWLGGIDDTPTAWINGVKLKQLKKGSAPSGRPWEFDAAQTLKYGKPNIIVVKVSNRRINELGTGGITGPAMLWAAP